MQKYYNTRVRYSRGTFDNYRVSFSGNIPVGFNQIPLDIDFLTYFSANRDRALDIVPQLENIAASLPSFSDIPHLNLPDFLNEEEGIIYTAYLMCLLAENYKINRNGRESIIKYRIKMIAFYQVMNEGFTPDEAANCSKGRTARELINLYDRLRAF